MSSRGQIEGRDLAVPMLDINTVSAGAEPSRSSTASARSRSGRKARAPCRGRPATAAAANCRPSPIATWRSGIFGEDSLLGGQMRLDAGPARAAIESKVAGPLGIAVTAAAAGSFASST